jgi:hypothetical protein
MHARMINFVVLGGHGYTFKAVFQPSRGIRRLPMRLLPYRHLFGRAKHGPGIWIFCDLERLAPWELRLAAEAAKLLREAGFKVMNDPARAAWRYELLLRLHAAGFNEFRAWRAVDGVPPARFPVFVRAESNHSMPLTDLIETPDALAAALSTAAAHAIPLRDLLVVEYQAEPIAPGVFRKFAAYRFGERIVADHMVHDITWIAKHGNDDAWSDERYAEEAAYVRDNPHAGELMRAFEIAEIGYGRADYGLVGGKVQVWEINTNPHLPVGDPTKAPPQRLEATNLARENRLAAMRELDVEIEGSPIMFDSELFKAHWERQQPDIPEMIRE